MRLHLSLPQGKVPSIWSTKIKANTMRPRCTAKLFNIIVTAVASANPYYPPQILFFPLTSNNTSNMMTKVMPRCIICDPSHLILDASSVDNYIWGSHFRSCRINGEKQASRLASSTGDWNRACSAGGRESEGRGVERWKSMLKTT